MLDIEINKYGYAKESTKIVMNNGKYVFKLALNSHDIFYCIYQQYAICNI